MGNANLKWESDRVAGLSEAEKLLYRSNRLGNDLTVTNYGGGNTSAKLQGEDPISGEPTSVLWVKGSGGDLGSMGLGGFATLYLDRLLTLERKYRGAEFEDEMAGYFSHCTFNNNPRAASIDTPLHAFLPFAHIDHMHPDAVIAIAASRNGQRITEDIYDGAVGWLPWQRPGFDLALRMRDLVNGNPDLRGIVLGGHGLFTWGDESESCYETTLWAIDRAKSYLRSHEDKSAFGGVARPTLDSVNRREVAGRILPSIRALVSESQTKVGHFCDDPEILEFVTSKHLGSRAALGTSCPDHFLRTKIKPLIVPESIVTQGEGAMDALQQSLVDYRDDYSDYYRRNADGTSPKMRDPNPVVCLIPGVGMATFAADKATARIASEFYINAVNVMREADRVDEYIGLDEREAFNIEYWALEEAKLQRLPDPKPMKGKVALITGAGGAIGAAVAERLLSEDAAVVLTDIDKKALDGVVGRLQQRFGPDNVRGISMDVTNEESVRAAFAGLTLEYGGLDVLVANAGIASSAPFEDTELSLWQTNVDVLATGYFLAAREAYRTMKNQQRGSIVFVGSKNALAAASGAAAYATAKAAELHLARCLALEGAPHGVRVNSVNPDAVLSGSKIWNSEWRSARARDHGVSEDQLADHYRSRSLLNQEVLPRDVAEAVYFFAGPDSAKSTGNILNVDAGNAAAFPR